MLRLHAHAHARKFVAADRADNRLQPVVASRASPLPDAQHAPGQRHVVVQHDHLFRAALQALQQIPHRQAAQIHHRVRLGQGHVLPGELAQADQRLGFRPLHANSSPLGDRVHGQKAQVMRRPRVLRTRIAEAHDQAHLRAHLSAHRRASRTAIRHATRNIAASGARLLLGLLFFLGCRRGPLLRPLRLPSCPS